MARLQLTDALRQLDEPLGLITDCRRYDIGDKLGWMKSSIELTLEREEFADEMRKFLSGLLKGRSLMTFDTTEELDIIRKNLGQISFEDQRVLVTGGAGFLGSWMCDTLLASGAHVTCVDNFASGQKENIQHLMDHERFRFIEHDISVPLHIDTTSRLCLPHGEPCLAV